jgi:hypothetical protein
LTGDKDERFVEEPSAVEPAFKNFMALPWLGVWKSPKVEASELEAPLLGVNTFPKGDIMLF